MRPPMATRAPIRLAISRKPAPRGPRGVARRAAAIAPSRSPRPRARDAGLDRARGAGIRGWRASRPMGLWRRDVARQGYAIRPLGDRGNAGRFPVGLFP